MANRFYSSALAPVFATRVNTPYLETWLIIHGSNAAMSSQIQTSGSTTLDYLKRLNAGLDCVMITGHEIIFQLRQYRTLLTNKQLGLLVDL